MNQPLRRLSPPPAAANVTSTPSDPSTKADDKVEIIMPAQYADRRSEPRFDCDHQGALLLAEGRVLPCRILDQSVSGARISVEDFGHVSTDLWLIDIDTHTVRRGSMAWSMATRVGLRFNFVQKLTTGQPRPLKVPEDVFSAWLRLNGQDKAQDDGDVVYFD